MTRYNFFLALIINIFICNSGLKNKVSLIKETNFSLTKRNNIRATEETRCTVNNDYSLRIVTIKTPAVTRITAIRLLSMNPLEDIKNWIFFKGN